MADGELIGGGERFGLSESQWRSVLQINAAEEIPVAPREASRPASIYSDDARFAAEMSQLFRRVPLAVTVSGRLPDPGSAMAHDGYGVPLLITRDRGGKVRAFINGCRHRGSMLVEGCEPVKANRLSCPYHAWTYDLDGTLIGIARPDTFPSLNKEDLPLVALPCYESGGMIWVGLDPAATPEPIPGMDAVCVDLDALAARRRHLYAHRRFDLAANWKLVLEPFSEAYHVLRLHANSVGPMHRSDITTVHDHFGHSSRQVSGRANFDPKVLEGTTNILKYITLSYVAFPNTVVITSPYYTSYMTIMPRAKDRSLVDYYMMVDGPADNPKAVDLYQRSFDLIMDVFGNEDFRASVISHQALATGAIPKVHFGGLEHLLGPLHDSIESYLEPAAI